ncbi:MAG TPA: hypothetical protein VFE23_06490 [Usitatibacter sp.]|nr:hypothetical protein [Usitatibacter sp.]
MTRFATMCVLCSLALWGCASADVEGPPHAEKQYRTGSNIPKREGSLPDGTETGAPGTGDTRLGPPGMPRPLPGGR